MSVRLIVVGVLICAAIWGVKAWEARLISKGDARGAARVQAAWDTQERDRNAATARDNAARFRNAERTAHEDAQREAARRGGIARVFLGVPLGLHTGCALRIACGDQVRAPGQHAPQGGGTQHGSSKQAHAHGVACPRHMARKRWRSAHTPRHVRLSGWLQRSCGLATGPARS